MWTQDVFLPNPSHAGCTVLLTQVQTHPTHICGSACFIGGMIVRGDLLAHVWKMILFPPSCSLEVRDGLSKYPKEPTCHHTCPPRWVPALPFHKHRSKDLPAALKICVYIYIFCLLPSIRDIRETKEKIVLTSECVGGVFESSTFWFKVISTI